MVGYVRNSTRDTYRMLHLDTERVTNSRDSKWTNILYGEMIGGKNKQIDCYTASEEEETDEDEESEEEKWKSEEVQGSNQ